MGRVAPDWSLGFYFGSITTPLQRDIPGTPLQFRRILLDVWKQSAATAWP